MCEKINKTFSKPPNFPNFPNPRRLGGAGAGGGGVFLENLW